MNPHRNPYPINKRIKTEKIKKFEEFRKYKTKKQRKLMKKIAQFSGVVDTQSSQEEKPAFRSVELEFYRVIIAIFH